MNIATESVELPKVALRSPTQKEKLPYAYVHFPNHYGTFISFSETLTSEHYLCACIEQAVYNYFELSDALMSDKNTIKRIPWQPSFNNYYLNLIKPQNKISEIFKFKPKLCHRCNMATPTLRWCHEMYGGNFKQYYGWYIKQASLKLGFLNYDYLPKVCPNELINKIKLAKQLVQDTPDFKNEEERKLALKYYKELEKLPENSARKEFGFRKIGDGWVSETILFHIVSRIFASSKIERHLRPQWMENLELDIYLPKEKIAFEYQGQQHFYPIEHWGGDIAFENLIKRDKRKKELCTELGIMLIEIDYTEPLTFNYISEKINRSLR